MTAGQIRAPTCIPLKLTPGNKQNIDDETPIELSSDTPNTTIFYSLNGEKPSPFDQKSKNTYTYHGPFLLCAGKRTLKSVAAYPDGRQSNIVTKVYWVTESDPVQDLGNLSLDSQITHDSACNQIEDEFKRRILAESFRNNVQALPPGGLYTATRAKVRPSSLPVSPTNHSPFVRSSTPTKQRGSTSIRQSKRRSLKIAKDVMKQVNLPEEYDPMNDLSNIPNVTFTKVADKCPECFTDKPPNPLSKYCHHCGHYLPPKVIDAHTVKCLHCHSIIPADLAKCVICNAVLTSQQINLPTNVPIVCTGCRFKNPPGSKTCVVCEEKLELTIQPAEIVPDQKHDDVIDENRRQCSKCKRLNSLIARYCDWCGCSMVDLSVTLPCTGCFFQNPSLALHCGNCGRSLLPQEPRNKPSRVSKTCWQDEIPDVRYMDQVMVKPDPLFISTDTQTDGIFYKSAKRLQAEEDKVTDNIRQIYKSRGLSVTKFSPGAGNWRQNIEHITNHIKVYSQLNSEYQDIIGKHMFGKVTMATLYKDANEIHLSHVFSTKKPPANRPSTPSRLKSKSQVSITAVLEPKKKRHSVASTTSDGFSDIMQEELRSSRRTESLSNSRSPSESDSVKTGHSKTDNVSTNGKHKPDRTYSLKSSTVVMAENGLENAHISSVCSEDNAALNTETKLRKSVRKKAPKDMHNLRIGKLNAQLLQEITKEGDEQRVSRVLGQGADPNTKSSGGVSVLCMAAKNRHVGAVKSLVQAGADLAFTVPSTKDTPLHIAVQQGSQEIIKYLVDRGCKFNVPNISGKTALDIARERHNQRAVQLFTSYMGSSLLSLK